MPSILIPGGEGCIGSHACKLLSRQGCLLLVLDNLRSGHIRSVKFGLLMVGDIEDEATVRRI
jgi:UDP-glucose 4-epimerase